MQLNKTGVRVRGAGNLLIALACSVTCFASLTAKAQDANNPNVHTFVFGTAAAAAPTPAKVQQPPGAVTVAVASNGSNNIAAYAVSGPARFAVTPQDASVPAVIYRWAKIAKYRTVTINGRPITPQVLETYSHIALTGNSTKVRANDLNHAVHSLLATSGITGLISFRKDPLVSTYAITVKASPVAPSGSDVTGAKGVSKDVMAKALSTVVGVKPQAQGVDPTPATMAPVAAASAGAYKWVVDLKDVTLSQTFTRWAEQAGWRVRWDADKHILVEARDELAGTFEQAVTEVLSSPGIAQGTYPLEVCFYPNKPQLARITRRGEQGKECK